MENTTKSGRIALISAPWPLFNRPSIQLGALKAYVQARRPDIGVECRHFFLQTAAEVGYPIYRLLARKTWLAESIFAALLHPEQRDAAARLFARQSKPHPELRYVDFDNLVERVGNVSDDLIRGTNWNGLTLAGFSVCLCQLTASLYFIKKIRQITPDLPLIAGGAIVGGQCAAGLLTAFPELDLVIIGEGENPLVRLLDHLRAGGTCRDLPPCPGIVRPDDDPAGISFDQMPALDALTTPDYSDYFQELGALPAEKRFFPTLPVEASRGCWWHTARGGRNNQPGGCAFCNLNIQWQGYRTKLPDQVTAEINTLTDRHQLLSVAFMDNALPPKHTRAIFQSLGAGGKDFKWFAELRAATSPEALGDLAASGITEVQIGIEALSTCLLQKLNKGATAMDNMTVMKYCEALGIKNQANLILHFPGSDDTDVAETLRAIRFARIFQPLRVVHFWLGMQSPVWCHPRDFGIRAVFNHPFYRSLFPEAIHRHVRFMIQDYRGDKQVQQKRWRPVARAVEEWQQDYRQLHERAHAGPILSYQDGGRFLLLRKRRIAAEAVNHRLEGTSRRIYLFCEQPRGIHEICDAFAPLPADRITGFLRMMEDKGLIFSDDGKHLSLAVPALS
ncbi:MAG: RiPP maturation radical SAM C-methyltransferase [Thermodesulfobacteriota bacterium]|nr:RiPP maturation radical SAM C-methyltransferase [Thermodesulfobacteriota bacterium]